MANLRVADIQVHELVHRRQDPTADYPESFPLQVAVYWSKPGEDILGLVHALHEMGIPFFVTRNLHTALRHRLLIIEPTVDATTFNNVQIEQLSAHVREGGSIFATNVFADALKFIFGFRSFQPSRHHYRVNFASGAHHILHYLNRPEEQEISLGNRQLSEVIWSNGYLPEDNARVLARFEDGTAALVSKNTGKGTTFLSGIGFQDSILRDQVDRDYEAQRHYVNNFEPSADVWMLLLRAWYESEQPGAIRIATIPDGNRSVLLLSHDIDWENSFSPALVYCQAEKQLGTSSTFFVQTKYVSDYNSKAFFFGKDLDYLHQLRSQGCSIGSHSIIHSRAFNKFELGMPTVRFATYHPRATGFETAAQATVFGEVAVSKQLLDGELEQQTVFFRAGHLRVPSTLPEALQRSGYQFDSSFTADDVLTNFPYALPLGLGFSEDSGIYEFPVTLEDEESPPLVQRIDRALEVIRANAENGAISVILIHSNEYQTKLPAEEKLIAELPPDIPAKDMLSFARFWRARDHLVWSVHSANARSDVLDFHAGEAIQGLTVEFQRKIATVSAGVAVMPDRHRIVLPGMRAGEQMQVRVAYQPETDKCHHARSTSRAEERFRGPVKHAA